MYGNLLVRKAGSQSLDIFIEELCECLGCASFEERDSSNYLEERYFRCVVLGIGVDVALADESEFMEYNFWISFGPNGVPVNDKFFFDLLADFVARKLVICGYQIIRPLDFGRIGSGGILYRPNPVKDVGLYEKVITERV